MKPSTSGLSRVRSSLGLFASGLLLASALGGVTNSFNGWISPIYFIAVMQWQGADDVWWASVTQGMAEGAVLGFVLSAIFTVGVQLISKGTCPFTVSLRYLLAVFGSVSVCWTVGGLLSVLLSLLIPWFYRFWFFGMPDEPMEMIRYAWVGGSIWGAQIGGILSTIVVLLLFRQHWTQQFSARNNVSYCQ